MLKIKKISLLFILIISTLPLVAAWIFESISSRVFYFGSYFAFAIVWILVFVSFLRITKGKWQNYWWFFILLGVGLWPMFKTAFIFLCWKINGFAP